MARLTRGLRLTGAFCLALSLVHSAAGQSETPITPAGAMPLAAAESEDSQKALADIEASLSLSQDNVNRLKAEIEAMRGDRGKQNAALIAAGERLKLAEADVAAVEQKIGDLIVQELETRGRLDGADGSISNVLAALERITRNPPPALIVDPSDALGSARSAMLISAILPQLQARAAAVMGDLAKLNDIKGQAEAEEDRLRANFDILEEEQLRIATLIAAQKENEQTAQATIAAEEQLASDLSAKAAALKQQIDGLSRRAQAVQTAAEATENANNGARPTLDDETVRLALANMERTEPAVPFLSAKGYLAFPANGVTVINYGDGDGFGGISKGVSVVTRAGASVMAPADGWVLYKGDYLNYGQIVILDAGQDYTILLAGLAGVSVDPGQFVLMGQQLGTMGSRTIGRTVATNAGAQNPTLYIEMRKDSAPIDPTGWWTFTTATQAG
ncbi:MAG: peptidoglycan DD-metalloendopeptidase family protein [Devosia sp.]